MIKRREFLLTNVRSIAVTVCVLLSIARAEAQSAPVVFDLIENKVDESGIQVFNGATAIGGNWSSVLVAKLPSATGLMSCTASLVGQRVILTAAHCVDQGTALARNADIRIGTTTLNFQCKMAREYVSRFPFVGVPRGPEDFALCWLEPTITTIPAKFLSLKREIIDMTPLASGASVLITGYGCTSTNVDLEILKIEDPVFNPACSVREMKRSTPSKV